MNTLRFFALIMVLIASENAIAQIPKNVSRNTDKWVSSSVELTKKQIVDSFLKWDKFQEYFLPHETTDSTRTTDLNIEILDAQIQSWEDMLSDPETKIVPRNAYYTALYIERLSFFTKNLYKRIMAGEFPITADGSKMPKNASIILAKEQKLDSLSKCFFGVNKVYGTLSWKAWFWPANNAIQSAMIYNRNGSTRFQAGDKIALFGRENAGAANPELLSFFIGPIRLSANTLVTSTSSESLEDSTVLKEEVAFRTITGNGGNLVINFDLPLFNYMGNGFNCFIELSPKFATDLPVLNSPFNPKDDLAMNANIGLAGNVNLRLGNSGFGLFIYARPAVIVGSKTYLDALGINETFTLFQYVFGIDIPKLGMLGIYPPATSSVEIFETKKWLASFTITPQELFKK